MLGSSSPGVTRNTEEDSPASASAAIDLALGPWVAVPDYAPAPGELYRSVVERFRSAGTEMPFPQREVRLLGAA